MNGRLLSVPPVAIDYWNLSFCSNVRYFFLTHTHCDHTQGLHSGWKRPIYCSPVTKKLLVEKLKIPDKYIHCLSVNVTISLNLDSKTNEFTKVTAFDANHCPGSVMFHFEGSFGQILYTGDFKYFDGMCQSLFDTIPHLHIDHLYIDDTYWNCKCMPTREEAINDIIKIIENHPGFRILIALYHLGKEYLLETISNQLNTPIYVTKERHITLGIIGFEGQTTTDYDDSDIHVVDRWNISKQLESSDKEHPTVAIIPSGYVPPSLSKHPKIFNVCLSDHSSQNDLVEFMNIIKPKLITGITNYYDRQKYPSSSRQGRLLNSSTRRLFIQQNKRKRPISYIDKIDDITKEILI